MARGDKGFARAKAAAERAAARDADTKAALAAKVNQKGGAGRLTRAERKLAERMGEGEGR